MRKTRDIIIKEVYKLFVAKGPRKFIGRALYGPFIIQQEECVITCMEKKWHIDHEPKSWEEDYKVWIYENCTLEHLDWDPLEYHWNIPN